MHESQRVFHELCGLTTPGSTPCILVERVDPRPVHQRGYCTGVEQQVVIEVQQQVVVLPRLPCHAAVRGGNRHQTARGCRGSVHRSSSRRPTGNGAARRSKSVLIGFWSKSPPNSWVNLSAIRSGWRACVVIRTSSTICDR